MKILAEYTVKKEELETVLAAIKLFLNEIKINEPETYYEAWQKKNSLEFVHIMKFKNREAQQKHSNAPYTTEFVKMLYQRCSKQPTFTDLNEIV